MAIVRAQFDELTFDNPRLLLGRGATSKVWRSSWRQQNVAVKVLNIGSDPMVITRELEIISRMRHERIITVWAVCLEVPSGEGDLAIVMELAQCDLQKFIADNVSGALQQSTCLRLALDVAEAMRYCHSKGVVHRDLKSQNVCITFEDVARGTPLRAKVMDFGLSRLLDSDLSKVTGLFCSPQYSAPETLDAGDENGSAAVHPSCDVYSFGVVLWEIAKREKPWANLNGMQIIASILRGKSLPIPTHNTTVEMQGLIKSCLDFDPARRPTFDEIHKDIYSMLEAHVRRKAEFEQSALFEYLCPIAFEPMADPVITSDGHSYDRACISDWLCFHDTSPLTNLPLENKTLIPNIALRGAIEKWQAAKRPAAAVPTPPTPFPAPTIAPAPASSHTPTPVFVSPESAAALAGPGDASITDDDNWYISTPAVAVPMPAREEEAAGGEWITPTASSRKMMRKSRSSGVIASDNPAPPASIREARPLKKSESLSHIGSDGATGTSDASSSSSSSTSIDAPAPPLSLRQQIHRSAEAGQPALLEALIERAGRDVSVVNWSDPARQKNTPMHVAARLGHLPCLQLLVAVGGVDINKANKMGSTPLHEACLANNVECVRLLLAQDGVAVNKEDDWGESALVAAAKSGNEVLVRMLLAAGCNWSTMHTTWFSKVAPLIDSVIAQDSRTTQMAGAPLIKAAKDGDLEALQVLTVGLNAAALNFPDEAHWGDEGEWIGSVGYSALMCSVKGNHVACVKHLLSTPGLLVNHQSANGDTALACAAFFGHTDCVAALVAVPELEPNLVGDGGWSPLCYASRFGYTECARLLLSRPDVDVNKAEASGFTPLALASFHGNPSLVKLLLQHPDVLVNKPSNNLLTPLICASGKGHVEICRMLASSPSIDIGFANAAGITAWFWANPEIEAILRAAEARLTRSQGPPLSVGAAIKEAAGHGDAAELQILLGQAAGDVEVLNFVDAASGDSALHVACWRGFPACVALLLAASPDLDVNRANHEGVTPVIACCANGHASCLRLLVNDARTQLNKLGVSCQGPLHYAVFDDHVDCVAVLLSAAPRIDVELRSDAGASAMDLARSPAVKDMLAAALR